MKKKTALALGLVLISLLTACGASFECDMCGETKTGKKYTNKELEMTICQDCYKELNDY